MMLTDSELKTIRSVFDKGGVIAYPTESVFGLGCDPDNLQALQKILTLKQRDPDKGLIILVSHLEQAFPYIQTLDKSQVEKISSSNQRATTWLIPKQKNISKLLCGNHSKLAVRITQHPIAQAICKYINKPLVSTSCNLSGESSLQIASDVEMQMGESLDYIVSGECGGQAPSKIIDLMTDQVLRA